MNIERKEKIRKNRTLIIYALVIVMVSSIFSGCVNELSVEGYSPNVRPRVGPPIRTNAMSFLTVVAPLKNNKIVGYIEEDNIIFSEDGKPHEVYYIYNANFKLVGFIMGEGLTYRYETKEKSVKVGVFPRELAIQALLDITDPILIRTLPED